jgi:hypothetical protein
MLDFSAFRCPSGLTKLWNEFNVLSPWSWVLLDKLIVSQLVKKIPAFYRTQRELSWSRQPTTFLSFITKLFLRSGLPFLLIIFLLSYSCRSCESCPALLCYALCGCSAWGFSVNVHPLYGECHGIMQRRARPAFRLSHGGFTKLCFHCHMPSAVTMPLSFRTPENLQTKVCTSPPEIIKLMKSSAM